MNPRELWFNLESNDDVLWPFGFRASRHLPKSARMSLQEYCEKDVKLSLTASPNNLTIHSTNNETQTEETQMSNSAIHQMVDAIANHGLQAPAPMPVAPALQAVPPVPAPVDPEIGMTDKQKVAFRSFSQLLERALAYRNGASFDDEEFDKDYGICDNIANNVPRTGLPSGSWDRSDYRSMVCKVKDNIICRTPSFSGSYSYPVPHPEYLDSEGEQRRRQAERAWDHADGEGARWLGAYGLARVNQLKEMVDIIQNQWDERFAAHMSPAMRNGIEKGTIVTIENQDGLWKLYRDDDSSDPYFQPVHIDGDEGVKHFSLYYVKKVDASTECEPMTVPEFLARHDELVKEQSEAEAEVVRIKALLSAAQATVGKVKGKIAVNDYFMGVQHKVRRM